MRATRIVLLGLAAAAIITGESRQASAQAARISPHERIDASIDGAALAITYGRPSMRGRAVMGRLVRYGRVWCPGADEATELSTSKPIRIGDLALAAGAYTLWMLPTAGDWTLIVNSQTGIYHYFHPERTDIGRVPLEKRALDAPVEQLTFALEKNAAGPGGTIRMTWETTDVSARFTVE